MSRPSARALTLAMRGPSVFAGVAQRARAAGAIDLGQGFPGQAPHPNVLKAASACIADVTLHQYARSTGAIPLSSAIARFQSRSIPHKIDPDTSVVVTSGATEALMCSIMAYIGPGDRVLTIQPFYDAYPAMVSMAGGECDVVSMSHADSKWSLDIDALRAAVTPATKMLILNNPNNPTGKVFSRAELEAIAQIAQDNNLIVIADEVYETLVYDDSPAPFIKFASLPGMYERTITIGSAGKVFGVTGWRIGWVVAHPEIARTVWMIHQYTIFAVATPLQTAVSHAFDFAESSTFFDDTRREYQELRNLLFNGLKECGFNPILPNSGYFIISDVTELRKKFKVPNDAPFSSYLIDAARVAGIPVDAFYCEKDKSDAANLIRFAFCKDAETLQTALNRLKEHFKTN